MLHRSIRSAGITLIETELSKLANNPFAPPSISGLHEKKMRELNSPTQTASAAVPKVVSLPTT